MNTSELVSYFFEHHVDKGACLDGEISDLIKDLEVIEWKACAAGSQAGMSRCDKPLKESRDILQQALENDSLPGLAKGWAVDIIEQIDAIVAPTTKRVEKTKEQCPHHWKSTVLGKESDEARHDDIFISICRFCGTSYDPGVRGETL